MKLIRLTSMVLLLTLPTLGSAASNISPTDKYAWSTNAGWVNFAPANGGVTVATDHLEGYAWAENVGWIKLGTYTSGGNHTYGNTLATDYGVNINASGNCSGYAWSSNVGWIKFNPTNGGVTVDLTTGRFDGYAWSENIGWIHFQNASPAYNVRYNAAPPVSPPVTPPPIVEVPPPLPSPRTLYLTVAGTGQGGVTSDPAGLDCSATSSACALTFDGPQWVSLTPTPDTGSQFSGWTGDPACTENDSGKLFLLENTTCTATFDLAFYVLTVERNVPGVTITGDGIDCQDTPQGFLNLEGLGNLSNNLSSAENPGCQAIYPYGTTITLEASKAPLEWEFVGWGGSCDSQGQVTITRETVCRAKYQEDPSIPNNLDGNGDGIPDTRQANVISLPDKVSSQYITFEVQPETCIITDVYTDLPDNYGKPDKNKPMPQGLIYFELGCPQAQISLYYHAVSVVRRNFIFQKYGPTVPGDESTVGWFTLPNVTFEAVKVGEKSVVKATYTVTDGGLGDSTGVDGRIVDPGGLGLP